VAAEVANASLASQVSTGTNLHCSYRAAPAKMHRNMCCWQEKKGECVEKKNLADSHRTDLPATGRSAGFRMPMFSAALGVVMVGLLAIAIGVSPAATAFWSLIPFTMQMCFNHHRWLRSRHVAVGGAAFEMLARFAAKRARCGGFCGADEHAGLVASLGH